VMVYERAREAMSASLGGEDPGGDAVERGALTGAPGAITTVEW
jgi:hypothetical protein